MELGTLLKLAGLSKELRREVMLRPWTVPWEDATWTLATDGKAMALALGETPEAHPIDGPAAKRVLEHLRMKKGGQPFPASVLKAWAGAPAWDGEADCLECEGRLRSACPECDEEKYCSLEHSGTGGTVVCRACRETGKVLRFPVRLGKAGGSWFNRNYVACLLEGVAGGVEVLVEVVRDFASTGAILVLTAGTFRIWLMSMHLTDKLAAAHAEAPSLECPSVKTPAPAADETKV